MLKVKTFQAKNIFRSLLDRVEREAEIVISTHGKPVARLVASSGSIDRWQARAGADRIGSTSIPRLTGKRRVQPQNWQRGIALLFTTRPTGNSLSGTACRSLRCIVSYALPSLPKMSPCSAFPNQPP